MLLWKCRSFWDKECLDWKVTRTQTGFMPNALTIWAIRARHLLAHVLEHWFRQYKYVFQVKIWRKKMCTGNSIHFLTHEHMFFTCESVEVFVTENIRPEGNSNSQPSDLCRMLYHLSYQGQTFPGLCLEHWLLKINTLYQLWRSKQTRKFSMILFQKLKLNNLKYIKLPYANHNIRQKL